ncbi:ABC transporter permease [Streptococcus agalactiae]|uniref:ABC transporter permease n=1 Tax=Streptococcus agalactiae TaxID=1311 RepID=UPI00178C305A|nr:ABC transporter permease [Streptococcus agalactiae]
MGKTFWKDIYRSITTSKGRFSSILLLMMLGSFAFIGLKVSAPNMQITAQNYLAHHHVMDITVFNSWGLDKHDQTVLESLKGSQVEFSYFVDTTPQQNSKSYRLYSNTKTISTFDLVKGRLPLNKSEIALSFQERKKYAIGDKINFKQDKNKLFSNTGPLTIVGFVNSTEIWSKTNLGSSQTGDGDLDSYGVLDKTAFHSPVYTMARVTFKDLRLINPFSISYKEKVAKYQEKVSRKLNIHNKIRYTKTKKESLRKIDEEEKSLLKAQKQINRLDNDSLAMPLSQRQAIQMKIKQDRLSLLKRTKELLKLRHNTQIMESPQIIVYNRTTFPGGQGYNTFDSSTNSTSKISNLFPIILYLVAALVTLTTMTRFVEEERTNAGILKALGYSDRQVIFKFIIYGFIAGTLGTTLGIIGGHYLLPRIISDIISKDLTIPNTQYHLFLNYSLLAFVFSLLSIVLPVFVITRRELKEKAAFLLLPKPPAKGSKIALEYINWIWKKLSFTQKVTARNIFRYKQRMIMTIFGVAGSVALLFSGLGIQSSLKQTVNEHFGRIMPYDILLTYNTNASPPKILELLSKDSKIDKYQPIHLENLDESIPGQINKQSISLFITDKKQLLPFIYLQEATTNKSLHLNNKGIIISKKLAQFYHVNTGDFIHLSHSQTLPSRKLKITGVVNANVGHYIFMTKQYYRTIFKKEAKDNAFLVKLTKHKIANNLAEKLLEINGVESLTQNALQLASVEAVVRSLDGSMTILVVVSLLLAIVILYNLTNINLAERKRELSTIKVLGFYNEEVTLYIYRETIILSTIGVILGTISGTYLHRQMMLLIGSDQILFGEKVSPTTFIIPISVVVIILISLGFIVNHQLKKLNMLDALKSVD